MLSDFLNPSNGYSTRRPAGPKMMDQNIAPGDQGGGMGGGGADLPIPPGSPGSVPVAPVAAAPVDSAPVFPTMELSPYSGGGGSYQGYGANGPAYSPGEAPVFNAPRFTPPSAQDVLANDPGYEFRLNAGRDALQNSAAAHGSLLTGGTLSDLIRYGQDYGAQEYQNAYNRALQGYNANYKAAYDEYSPQFQAWATSAGIDSQQALAAQQLAYQNYWNQQNQDYNSWLAWQQLQLSQSDQINNAVQLGLVG